MKQKFEYQVENFDGLELIGWISFDVDDELDIDIEIVGLGRSKIKSLGQRPDLLAAKGAGSGELRIALDDLFPDLLGYSASGVDGPYRVIARACFKSGREIVFFEFLGSWTLVDAASAARSKLDGRIDTFDEKWISGWAVSDGSEPVKIEIVDGDKIIATTFTGLYRADVARIHRGASYSGFVMATPQSLCDGFPHSVSVRLGSGWVFPNFPREVRLGRVLGVVEKIDTAGIEGWFGFLRTSDQSNRMLTILCNGEPIGVTNFYGSRPDVIASGLASSAFIFKFATKRGIFAEDIVSVVDMATGYQLRVSEAAKAANLPSAIVGHLDQVGESEIVGWALDRRAPADALRVLAYSDGIPIAEAKTEGFRADVQRVYPQSLRPGFTIRTPSVLRDGLQHKVELRVSSAARALGGTPTNIQLSRPPRIFRGDEASALSTLDQRISIHARLLARSRKASLKKGVSHIILNKNGGDVFVRCLESLLKFMDFSRDELIVVDHASDDVSREALVRLEDAGLVTMIWKTRNDSFSKSNNDAAAIATKPILLLLNNDIEFVGAISRRIEELLDSSDIGAVGIKLYDIVESSPDEAADRNLRELRIQHLGVWFLPGSMNSNYNLVGYDITAAAVHREIFGLHDVAVVTGAALGIRAADFRALGGLDETYFYGTEDIDLCLRVRQTGKRIVCDRSLEALHVRGYTRFTRRGGGASERFSNNNKHLWTKLGATMRRHYLQSIVARDGVYAPPQLRIGFAVTEAGDNVVAGDYFTALELARSLADHHGVEYVFLSEKEDWYDCNGLDVVVVMRHDYDVRRVRNQKPHCLFVGWARNQFETFLYQPWLERFDAMLSSSKLFSYLLYRRTGIRAHTLYIATSFSERPATDNSVEQDVVFVGSRWGGARDVEEALVPERINGSVRIYGAGFDEAPSLRAVWGGVLPYAEVEGKYHHSRIVVDDANPTTKRWGSPNSRVFDAIAAGCVVLTNSAATSSVLEGTIPVWKDAEQLTAQINYLLANEDSLVERAASQAAVVKAHHSYAARAQSFLDILKEHAVSSLRIDILTAVPREANSDLWGDWHFAQSLARAFRKRGHAVRLRKLGEKPDRATDVVLGLRGLQRFTPVVGAINLLWVISHPDLVAGDELKGWQHVFMASQTLADRFAPYCESISVLEQATEFKPTSMWAAHADRREGATNRGVFVGNTRGVPRPFIELAAAAGLDFQIWGEGWNGSPVEDRLIASSIANNRLGPLYAAAAFVLSDHWPDMAKQGIVSNRVFDALAAGGVVITDPVQGIEALGLPNLFVCRSDEDVKNAVKEAATRTFAERLEGGRMVCERFGFQNRAEQILNQVSSFLRPR